MSELNESLPKGIVRHVGVLNLLAARSPEDLQAITSIEQVGVVLVPETLGAAIVGIPMEHVGAVVPVPVEGKYNLISGQTSLTGEALAAGDPDTVLIVAGQVVITTPVGQVGYKQIHIAGQVMAPRGSEAALTSAIKSLLGQVFYYPVGARFVMGDESFGRDYLQYLPGPTPHVVMGQMILEDSVSADLLREKIPEIVIFGEVQAPKALVPLLQVLSPERMGEICGREPAEPAS